MITNDIEEIFLFQLNIYKKKKLKIEIVQNPLSVFTTMGNKILTINSEEKIRRSKRFDKSINRCNNPKEEEESNIETKEMINLMKSFGKLSRLSRCNSKYIFSQKKKKEIYF